MERTEYDDRTEWTLNGKLHRTDGPAVEYANGDKFWYLNGKLHRTDGPAVEYYDGSVDWFLNDEEVTIADVLDDKETFTWALQDHHPAFQRSNKNNSSGDGA